MSLFSPIGAAMRLTTATTANLPTINTPHRYVHIKKFNGNTIDTKNKQAMLEHLKEIAEELDMLATTATFGPNFVQATHAYVDTLKFIWEIESDQRPPKCST